MQSIPKQMKALVLTAPGKFEIQDVPVPTPGPFEVLCGIGAVAICGTDPEVIKGSMAGYWPPAYPFIPGHEPSGIVAAVGPGVTQFREGDEVIVMPSGFCGHCDYCRSGQHQYCEKAFTTGGDGPLLDLTDAAVKKFIKQAKARGSRVEIPDAVLPGLYLIVQPTGAKSWAVRYRIDSRTRKLTLTGRYPVLSGWCRDRARRACRSP